MARLFVYVGVFALVGVLSAFLGALGYVTVAAIQQLLAEYEAWVAWLVWTIGVVWVLGATWGIASWLLRRKSRAATTERQVILVTPGDLAKMADAWRKSLPRGVDGTTARRALPSRRRLHSIASRPSGDHGPGSS